MENYLIIQFIQIPLHYQRKTALTKAIDYIGADTYKWELAAEEALLKTTEEDVNATYYPKGELVYINEGGLPTGELKLTYRFNILCTRTIWQKRGVCRC